MHSKFGVKLFIFVSVLLSFGVVMIFFNGDVQSHLSDDALSKLNQYRMTEVSAKETGGLPAISIACAPYDLYDPDNGLLVEGTLCRKYPDSIKESDLGFANWNCTGDAFERLCVCDFLSINNSEKECIPMQFAVRGARSRSFPQKGYKIQSVDDKRTCLALVSDYEDISKIKILLSQELANELDLVQMELCPMMLFLNKECDGIRFVGEDFSEEFFIKRGMHYGNTIFIKRALNQNKVAVGNPGDIVYYYDFLDSIRKLKLEKDEEYEKALAYFDEQSCIDYYAYQLCITNRDWPHNNFGLFRSRKQYGTSEYEDTKWRFVLFDVNAGSVFSPISLGRSLFDKVQKDPLFLELSRNAGFRKRFTQRVCDILYILFDEETVMPRVQKHAESIADAWHIDGMKYHPDNPNEIYDTTQTYDEYFYRVKELLQKATVTAMHQPELLEVALVRDDSSNCKKVRLDGLDVDLSNGSWTGRYCQGAELHFSVAPEDESLFLFWQDLRTGEVICESSELSVVLTDYSVIKPVFRD